MGPEAQAEDLGGAVRTGHSLWVPQQLRACLVSSEVALPGSQSTHILHDEVGIHLATGVKTSVFAGCG